MKQQYTCKEETCRKEFTRTRSTQEFCCDNCRFTWHNRIKAEKLRFADQQGFDLKDKVTEEDLF